MDDKEQLLHEHITCEQFEAVLFMYMQIEKMSPIGEMPRLGGISRLCGIMYTDPYTVIEMLTRELPFLTNLKVLDLFSISCYPKDAWQVYPRAGVLQCAFQIYV